MLLKKRKFVIYNMYSTYLRSVMIGRYVLFNTNFWRCFLRNEFWSEKWIRNVRCYWIKLSKILLHRWINIWNGDFKMSKTKHWNILCDLGFDVRYDLIKCNPAWDWIKNWKKKKITLFLYLYHEPYFMSFHELNWTLYSGFGKKI